MANVIIPNHFAGIGDVVCVKFSGGEVSDKIVVKGTTYTGTAPTGYTPYGFIFGFDKGAAYIAALTETTKSWANNAAGSWGGGESAGRIVENTTVGANTIRLRNGQICTYYANMNTARVAGLMVNASSSNDDLHPVSAHYGSTTAMSPDHFNTATTENAKQARQLYKTYEAYIDQMSPLMTPEALASSPTPLGGPFSLRCGKRNTEILGVYTASNLDPNTGGTAPCWYPAANYCYNYAVSGENAHHWWLGDMYEIGLLMEDATYKQYHKTTNVSLPSNATFYWSSVRSGATLAWNYHHAGMSGYHYFFYGLAVRPLSLLKL